MNAPPIASDVRPTMRMRMAAERLDAGLPTPPVGGKIAGSAVGDGDSCGGVGVSVGDGV
jgi:hypothetical protein